MVSLGFRKQQSFLLLWAKRPKTIGGKPSEGWVEGEMQQSWWLFRSPFFFMNPGLNQTRSSKMHFKLYEGKGNKPRRNRTQLRRFCSPRTLLKEMSTHYESAMLRWPQIKRVENFETWLGEQVLKYFPAESTLSSVKEGQKKTGERNES